MIIGKATHNALKRHNRLLLLRAVSEGEADNRAALAQVTGLAKPTVSDLISELLEEGLLIEIGHGEAGESGGKRPILLRFVPDSRQVIGVSIDSLRVRAVLSNLEGRVIAEHYTPLRDSHGADMITILREVINGLICQLDAPLLCIGVGLPGMIEDPQQKINPLWRKRQLADMLTVQYGVPVYIANNTELTAMAQLAFGSVGTVDGDPPNIVTLRVGNTVEVGVALRGAQYHHGGDISALHISAPSGGHRRLDSTLGWSVVRDRAHALRSEYPHTMLPADGLTYMHIYYAALNGDALAARLYDEIADALADVTAWVIALLHPTHVALAGAIVELGDPLLDRLREKAAALLPNGEAGTVDFSLATMPHLSAIGAVAQAIQNELGIL